MRIPGSTYRVQLNKDFRFEHARALLPYLQRIGITDLYCSPICKARSGSMHGYDVADPTKVNPELGTEEDFDALVEDLHERGMRLLLDIVPNHMAASLENPWWTDVLEHGSASVYAAFFDIEWSHATPAVKDKIVLPILGGPYGSVLEDRKLELVYSRSGMRVRYSEQEFPLDPATYHSVLSFRLNELLHKIQTDDPALKEFGLVLELAERLPPRNVTEWEMVELRRRESLDLKERLWAIHEQFPVIREFVEHNIHMFNGVKGHPSTFDRLDHLLDQQPYQLTFWRAARERMNYRRFFDVTDLISIRAQDANVFQATHERVLRWVEGKKADGLRIDHVDGLYDPLAYLSHLQATASERAGEPIYITVEKILSGDETLPNEWPIAGTTGYEFLGAVNNLFIHPEGLKSLTSTYTEFIKDDTSFYEIAYAQKKKIVEDLFAGEIRTLGLHLTRIAERYRNSRDLSPQALSEALLELTASMPVYRTYTRDFRVGSRDRVCIDDAIASARKRNPGLNPACFDFLRRVLLVELQEDEDALRFVMRWQQLTGPVMAKGVEDTTLYLYNRLTSMNDVGGGPEPVSIEQFHRFNAGRRQQWTGTMNATSTHDTKRSEDVRARINILAEMPVVWQRRVNRWHRANKARTGSDFSTQDPNQEYLLYQTLLGVWPLDDAITPEFVDRIRNYMIKAAREAKAQTSWLNQNGEYEEKMLAFVGSILQDEPNNAFLADLRKFEAKIAFYGAINSLAQTVLKMICPGVPDFYQGTTLWDLSLVDPDNRRPAQIAPRLELLAAFDEWEKGVSKESIQRLLECWQDGRVKAFLIFKVLQLRKQLADLFENGEYLGLTGTGLAADHTVSLARRRGDRWLIAVAPRFLTSLSANERWPLGRRFWKDSGIVVPEGAPANWRNIFTGELVAASPDLAVADLLSTFPVAVVVGE